MKIAISGASGFVGTSLTRALRVHGDDVRPIVRAGDKQQAGDIHWDPTSAFVDMAALEGTDAVLHLSGAGIADKRWSDERKRVLRSSRIDTTRVLVDAISRLQQKPKVFVCASAIGIYGDRDDEILTETSPHGPDFLSLLARDWEAEATRASHAGIRTVMLRFGIILDAHGGALPVMMRPFHFGVGGKLGSGKQWMSWIALEDVVEIIRAAIAKPELNGPMNVVSPNPVRNEEFTRILAHAMHRPALLPALAFALRLALGEMADALLLSSQRVQPSRLDSIGYTFRFSDLDTCIKTILAEKP